jgi:hypothetical protein
VGEVADQLISRARESRPFDFDRHEVLPLWLEAANERLEERRRQIPLLDSVANDAGVDRISRLSDLVPLLFTHATYKSYPRSYIERRKWASLTRWLNSVSTSTIQGLDYDGVETQDDWLAVLAAGGFPVFGTSGTSGKSSFLPATPGDRAFTMECIVRAVEWQHGIPARPDSAVLVLASSTGSSRSTEYFRNFARSYGDPQRTWFLTDEPVRLADLSRMASLSKAIGEGKASPSEIADFESDMQKRRLQLESEWDRLVDVAQTLAGQRVLIQGFWAQQWSLVERLRARGIGRIELAPDSLLGTGGGTKGVDLPADYEIQVADFWGISPERQSSGTGCQSCRPRFPRSAIDMSYNHGSFR